MATPENAAPPIGFVGLGNMGLPMAGRLAAAGHRVRVADASSEAVSEAKAAFGAEAPADLGGLAASCPVVITMLPNHDVVRTVVLGGDGSPGLVDGWTEGATLIDMSSSSPTGTVELADTLTERGIGMLDAPVSGGVPKARSGELTIMVGGDADLVARHESLFAPMGARLYRTGAIGSGQAMKALNNLLSAVGLWAAAEALLVGKRFGLDPALMIEILNVSTGRNNSTENKMAQHVLSRTFASGFGLDLLVKDIATALALADELGLDVPVSTHAVDQWRRAQERIGHDADHTEAARYLEMLNGIELTR